jgi:hypothetical protein
MAALRQKLRRPERGAVGHKLLRCHAAEIRPGRCLKWEADTWTAPHSILKLTARPSASAGAFTFGWVGWTRHSRLTSLTVPEARVLAIASLNRATVARSTRTPPPSRIPGSRPGSPEGDNMDYAGRGKGCGQNYFAQIVQTIEIAAKNLWWRRKTEGNRVNLSTPPAGGCLFFTRSLGVSPKPPTRRPSAADLPSRGR